MGMIELRDWVAANLDIESTTIAGTTLTLREAMTSGHAEAVTSILNRVRKGATVARGVVASVACAAELTPGMYAQLTASERDVLVVWLSVDQIDLDGPAVAPVLARIGYPMTHDGSIAGQLLGHALAPGNIPDALVAWGYQAPQRRIEERKVCAADGSVWVATYDDGVERSRHPLLDGTGKARVVAGGDVTYTESQINLALAKGP